ATWFWIKKYLYLGNEEDAETVESARCADAIIVETVEAKRNFLRFLSYHGAASLGSRIYIVPNAVMGLFLQKPLPLKKVRKVVAGGRWDDPQKDPRLLAGGLARYLKDDPGAEVIIVGVGGEPYFAPLGRQFRQLKYLGRVSKQVVADHLASARIIAFSSRWEGAPLAASEALTLGCSVVGPKLPAFISISSCNRFGRVFAGRTARALAGALR